MIRDVTCSDGLALFVEDRGPRDGPAILFAHEFGGDWRTWDGLVRRLAPRVRCVRYAARGFLPSQAPDDRRFYGQERSTRDLVEVADALALERLHLVGCSMGSFTSLMAALQAPGRFHSLTLIGCSSGPRDAAERESYRAALRDELALLRTRGGEGAVAWFAEDAAYRRMPEKVPEVWRAYLERLGGQSLPGAINTLETLHWNRKSLFDLEDGLRGLRVPTNLVHGEEDHPLVGATNAFLHDVLPSSWQTKVPRSGHLVHLEEEQRVLDLLSAILRGHARDG